MTSTEKKGNDKPQKPKQTALEVRLLLELVGMQPELIDSSIKAIRQAGKLE